MRVSTLGFQTDASSQMSSLEVSIDQIQTELSTGIALQSAADNPAAMAQVNQLNAQISASAQYQSNGTAVTSNLQIEEQSLSDATTTMQSARDLALEANNPSLTSAQRSDIATQVSALLQQLVSTANTTDSNGNFLFSGETSGTQPFSQSGTSVTYNGSTSVSQVQISSNQRISSGDAGSNVFMNIPGGNGTFTTSVGAANTGTATIDAGTVTNASQWAPDTYTITFTDATDYTVTNGAGAAVAGGTYTTPGTISFNGVSTTISGTPAAGDTFTVAPAGTSSAFATLSNLVTTLNDPTLTSAQISTAVGTAVEQIDSAVSNFSNVSASVGARINSVTASATTATASQTVMKGQVMSLQDVDYAAATTQLSSQELALQAAQESYASIAKMSLFSYLQ